MRIVVVGLGKVGRALAAQLAAEGHDIVGIDQNGEIIDNIVNIYDVRGVAGNGGCYDVQKEAFEDGADLLIATTSSDEINILSCLVAKKIGTRHTIARIRNPEYEKQLRFMREELGLSMVINPEKATSREIARVLRFPSAIKREQFCRQRFELVEYRVGPDNPLVGMPLADLYRNIRVKILVCAVARGQETIIPSGSFELQAGDKIYLTASPSDLEAFFRKLHLFKERANNIMIVGAGRMTYYLVKELQDVQKRVTVIDNNLKRCQDMSEKFPGVLVIHGDGADSELLSEERITEMDAFVALTGMDESNIILAMYASQFNSCKVVAKINRPSFADLATANNLVDSVVSTASVTSEAITRYVRAMQNSIDSDNIKTLHRLVGGRVEALEFNVGPGLPFIGKPLKDVQLKDGLLIVGIVRRNGQTVIPSGDDALSEGDDVVVVTTDTTLHALRDIVK
ncbi:MAG: Trk system potassium transporter TrkA [Gemmiger sp.]|uniref:Trk system potassium transporter TrkA n=1 Tax=Gemmiger sp. TaxID=2049027 RepID=UPI002E774FBF|nr:Trk system potassium transporter TrkA [Gemmiger sp.]MEE0710147.1 Trk system potassium transporter TrkA [Gemmiger sp.]